MHLMVDTAVKRAENMNSRKASRWCGKSSDLSYPLPMSDSQIHSGRAKGDIIPLKTEDCPALFARGLMQPNLAVGCQKKRD